MGTEGRQGRGGVSPEGAQISFLPGPAALPCCPHRHRRKSYVNFLDHDSPGAQGGSFLPQVCANLVNTLQMASHPASPVPGAHSSLKPAALPAFPVEGASPPNSLEPLPFRTVKPERRGTDTPVHHQERPAGSTHRSTRGLRPRPSWPPSR